MTSERTVIAWTHVCKSFRRKPICGAVPDKIVGSWAPGPARIIERQRVRENRFKAVGEGGAWQSLCSNIKS